MSISSAPTTSFDGVVSGLNTTSIINGMMSLAKQPLTSLQRQLQTVQHRDTAYQTITSGVSSLQLALQTLLQPSNVNAKLVSNSTPGTATAVANADAVTSSFTLNVSQLATATTATSANPIHAGLTAANAITSAGFALTPTAGTVTINGVQITINATDTLSQVLNNITDSSAGGAGVGTGVTATLVNDANGNPDYINLTPIAGNNNPIQLGAASDTSNFLAAADLVATGVAGGGAAAAVQSGAAVSATSASALSTLRVNGGGTLASSGSFVINGATINWSNTDTLSAVLNRINASSANVRATYDPIADKGTFANLGTGNQAIILSDNAGGTGVGLLQALGISQSSENFGKTAQYTVAQNGVTGPTQYSNSNTVSNVVTGVTASLLTTGSTTMSVTQDTSTAITNVNSFITAFNQLEDTIDTATAYNASTSTASVLTGDSTIQGLGDQLRELVANPAAGTSGQYTNLASIGISTGAFGSAIGTTNHLQLDSAKFTAALQSNPTAVMAVLAGSAGPTLDADGYGNATSGSWISSLNGSPPSGSQYGSYKVTVDSSGNLSSVFTPFGGGALPATTRTIAANGTNSTLIAGLSITAGALPAAGMTRTDTITYDQPGLLGRLNDYLNNVLGSNGLFASESSSTQQQTTDLNDQINNMNDMLAKR